LKEALQNRHFPRRKLLSSNDFQRCDNTYVPTGDGGGNGKEFNVLNPREHGFEIEFKAKKLGAYLIEPHWLLKDNSYLYGYPIIVVVLPPRDDMGRPIVKDEWLP